MFQLLPHTKDVWAVDYMPVQIAENKLVQFVYNPDYLKSTIKWSKTISDVDTICKEINISPQKSDIVLDGGNVVRTSDKIIMCDKIFSENPTKKIEELIKELQNIFQVDKLIFIPTNPIDFTGHADGLVRFYDDNTVLINDYSKGNMEFQIRLRLALHNAGLNYIEIPCNTDGNARNKHANGEYINYLQMQQVIIIPAFGLKEDDVVKKQFEQLFTGQTIISIESNDIAYEGGILNCISWNILK